MIKRNFVSTVLNAKGGRSFGLVYSIMKLSKSRGTKQSDYVGFCGFLKYLFE